MTGFFVDLHSASDPAADSPAEAVLEHFNRGCYEVTIALTDDTPSGNGSQLPSTWQNASSELHERGPRCFVVRRPRATMGCAGS